MTRLLSILIFSLLSFAVIAEDLQKSFLSTKNPYISGLKNDHQAAINLINKGEYNSAWAKLLPLAKKGDENAMYILGKMIIATPSLHHKLSLAERLLTEASKLNHVLAKQALKELKGIKSIEDIQQSYVKSFVIDNQTKSLLSKAKKIAAGRKPREPEFEFLFFINEISPRFNNLMPIASQLQQRIGSRAKIQYILVTNSKNISDNRLNQRVDRFEFPQGGIGIDADGVMAKKYGIATYPTVVAINGDTYKTVKAANSASTTQMLLQFYRVQEKQ